MTKSLMAYRGVHAKEETHSTSLDLPMIVYEQNMATVYIHFVYMNNTSRDIDALITTP
jgi:hypothetical protein